jgi:hypothetical protein
MVMALIRANGIPAGTVAVGVMLGVGVSLGVDVSVGGEVVAVAKVAVGCGVSTTNTAGAAVSVGLGTLVPPIPRSLPIRYIPPTAKQARTRRPAAAIGSDKPRILGVDRAPVGGAFADGADLGAGLSTAVLSRGGAAAGSGALSTRVPGAFEAGEDDGST